jgi:acetyl esterase/lipase
VDVARIAGRIARFAVRACLGYLLLVALAGQVLAWTPPSWWVPMLRHWSLQVFLTASGFWRDAFGAWIVVAVAVVLALIVLEGRTAGRRLLRTTVVVACATLVSSVALTVHQVVDARRDGAQVGLVAPAVPFREGVVQPDRRVSLGTVDGTALVADLYLPHDATASGGVPVIVNVHGGGFTSGAPAPVPTFPALIDRGWGVLDVSYRLATTKRHTWDLAVRDVGCALTWVTRRGPAAGLDPDRVGLMGDSAGGQLAINAANLGQRLSPSCGSSDDLPEVSAVVGLYPAVDGAAAYDDTALGRAYGDQYVGGSPERYPDRYAFTDSVTHLRRDGPPLLVVQGGADHLILPGPVRAFAEASRRAGTTTRYVELPGQDHTLGHALGTLSFGTLVARDLAARWFEEHLPARD